MRIITCVAACAAIFANSAAANVAYVLTFDPQTAHGKHQIALTSLSPDLARLVLAQRTGVEDYHLQYSPSDADINALNQYGSKSSIFQPDTPEQKALLLAELPEEHESHTKLRLYARFTIDNAPDFGSTQDLLQDMYTQSHPDRRISRTALASKEFLTGTSPLFHVASDANELIKIARELAAKKVAVTAVLIPAGKRSTTWGTYDMPSTGKHDKRQVPHRLQPEEPLEEFTQPIMALANSSNSSSNYTNSRPLKGILPSCFSSKRACESNTRGCTGHGECTLKWTNKDHPDSSKSGECWGCACISTKSNGLTTKWAGPACQKKDISVEFWLITLFTIGLVGLVSFAVGNLLSMGEQELPSVIGAGVSGPSARK